MVTTPLVSICIPAFRAEKYLQETLDSIRAQTFGDWEVIVTEDGSKDRAEEITRAFAQTVSQTVTYSRHEVNQGLPATRNTGIALARGQFVALLDSDDYWSPTHLEDLVATQKARDLDFVHSGSILFDNDTKAVLELRRPTELQVSRFPLSLYAEGYVIQPSSVMVRKTVFEKLGGYDVSFRYCEDIELWFRAAKNGVTFGFTGKDTCHYRKHGGALTAHGGPMAFAAARAYVKHFDWASLPAAIRKQRTSSQLASAGRIYLRSEPGRAWGIFQPSVARPEKRQVPRTQPGGQRPRQKAGTKTSAFCRLMRAAERTSALTRFLRPSQPARKLLTSLPKRKSLVSHL